MYPERSRPEMLWDNSAMKYAGKRRGESFDNQKMCGEKEKGNVRSKRGQSP